MQRLPKKSVFSRNYSSTTDPMLKPTIIATLNCLLLFIGQSASAQISDPSFESNGHFGFFIANQPKSLYLRNAHSRLIEINVSRQTTGKKSWERENNYPRLGIALMYGDLGSKQYLGSMTAIYPFIHFPLLRTRRSVSSFRLGAGLGWVEKPYDKEDNYKNLMIGTHMNATISMRLQTEWRIVHGLYMNAGLAFTHLSNGSYRLPNLGLNIPTIAAGLRYGPEASSIPRKRQREAHIRKTSLFIFAGGAFKQTYPLESTVHLIRIANFELARSLSPVSSVNAGILISHDKSLSNEIANAPTYIFDNSELQLQASAYLGYEHIVGRLSIPIQLGVYLYNNYATSQIYQLIGLRYRISGKWLMSLQLKAHYGKADYIQYAIGYKIF